MALIVDRRSVISLIELGDGQPEVVEPVPNNVKCACVHLSSHGRLPSPYHALRQV
jgi:hypothetical protein